MNIRSLVVALPFAIFAACSSGGTTGVTCPTNSTLTYENFGKSFMASNCTRCHGGRESPSLLTVENIRAHADEIDSEAGASATVTNTRMPEDGSVSLADRKKLSEWLACGAP
ncbi:MAG: hypothetical protein U0174_28305 [Polyangiaceae bacterium]